MVMKMLKYCQNLVEDEVLKQYDLKKCRLYKVSNSLAQSNIKHTNFEIDNGALEYLPCGCTKLIVSHLLKGHP